MSETKHSPGPWFTSISGRYVRYRMPADSTHFNICDCEMGAPPDEQEANARLIAAAPTGLKVAQAAYLALLNSGAYRLHVQEELCALRNYIAQATGRDAKEVQDDYESHRLQQGA